MRRGMVAQRPGRPREAAFFEQNGEASQAPTIAGFRGVRCKLNGGYLQNYAVCQPARLNPATRENSLVLRVTRVRPWASAMAAIIRSFGPMGVPRRAR